MKKILLIAFLLRLLLSFLTYHPDTLDFLGWSKDIEKNGLSGIYYHDVDDAGPANYPPLYYVYLKINNDIYKYTKNVLWFFNSKVPLFPSNLYILFDADTGRMWFNKLTPIIFDLGVGYLVYKIVLLFYNHNNALKSAALYLLLPPSWYLSSLWGQIDSVYIFFILMSLYFLFCKKTILSITSFGVSLSIKPNAIFILPLFAYYFLRYTKLPKVLVGFITTVFIFYFSAYIFTNNLNPLVILNFYLKYIREISGYVSSNAFNFWGMLYGFGPRSDSELIFGISMFWWGIFFYLLLLYFVISKYSKDNHENKLLECLYLLSFGAFLFLTRMHERYFYLTYVLLTIVLHNFKTIGRNFLLITFVFFLNLYHFWWYPYFGVLKAFYSQRIIENMLCLINLGVYYKHIKLVIGKKQ